MSVPLRRLLPILVLLSTLGVSIFATQIPSSTAWAGRSSGMATRTYSISGVSPLSVKNNASLSSHPAQPTILSPFATQTTSPITRSVELAPAKRGVSPYEVWIYHTKEIAIIYRDGPVVLAGTPDGRGDVTADDAVRIEVTRPDNTVRIYEYVYGYPKHFGHVESTRPVNLTDMFQIGLNKVRIDLIDNLPCCWGSSAYYLVGTGFRIPPALDLPIAYSTHNQDTTDRGKDFALSALGNDGKNKGRVNSWFDHTSPNYTKNGNLTRWDGEVFTETFRQGISWYDGHNGIDFSPSPGITDTLIYAAATGVVTRTVSNCVAGDSNCGNRYGNQVWIDHGWGYATLYSHLRTVSVTVGLSITNVTTQPLGVMGNTGNSTGTHLHFGVYYDQNEDGQWQESEVLDPYGLRDQTNDTWDIPSFWRYTLVTRQNVPPRGTSLATPSGRTIVTFPSGAVRWPTTLHLWDLPPTAGAYPDRRAVGNGFWLEVPGNVAPQQDTDSHLAVLPFARDVTIVMSFVPTDTRHLDESRLRIYWRDPATGVWKPLPTTIDLARLQATTSHALGGRYELQAPLKCPADTLEPNDTYDTASGLDSVPTVVSGLFDSVQDQDWLQLNAVAGARYTLTPTGASKPAVQLVDRDGITRLSTMVSRDGQLIWVAPATGIYFIALSNQETTVNGCDASYTLSIEVTFKTFLPVVTR